MDIDEAIRNFAATDHVLPRDSIRWALDNWEVAGPRFVDLLDRYAAGIDRTDETATALFFIVHLLGEKRETAAFQPLRRLLLDDEASITVLGDAITETLAGVLIATFDGNLDSLKEVIELTAADEFVRGSALEAMAYLTRTGSITDAEMRAYLLHLIAEMRPQAECHVWTVWCFCAANLGYRDYESAVKKLVRRGFVDCGEADLEDFHEQVRLTLSDPTRMAGFNNDRVRPFEDTIGTLSAWDGFSEQFQIDEAHPAVEPDEEPFFPMADEPYVNPHRHVGRNDPCPCGSGKKYKKCCLQRDGRAPD